ncbi:MAG TPA: hypothetical protein DDY13_00425 [Cytophagales bacterium]|jgi:class 3 adenylate cyclase|nr:hypothetical protein [Cytophagales bacterium]
MTKHNASILLIDDDPDILLAAKFLLKKHFTKIKATSKPYEVPEILQNEFYDIILLDLNYSAGATSGQEGFQLLGKIKNITPDVKVIMMTAYGDIDLAIRAMKEGAEDFIVKPWDNSKLIATVVSAFKKKVSQNHKPLPVTGITPERRTELFSEEERIFMFLDINSSTSIAETLGHVKYFQLLQEFFEDIAAPINNRNGQIYQYVGDEVVITWDLEEGLKNQNCLRCFFDIKFQVQNAAEKYEQLFGLVPTFKAGLHFGRVSTGVVGTIKKEVIYTGDVLNTTSRLEGLCHTYGQELLVSKDLVDLLSLNEHFSIERIGNTALRGKLTNVVIFTVQPILSEG